MNMKPIKIVSYNTYLIANRFNKNRNTHPEKRASKICGDFLSSSGKSWKSLVGSEKDKNIIKPDLCFFQEVWGSGIPELTENIDYLIPPRRSSFFSWIWPPVSPSVSEKVIEFSRNHNVVARSTTSFYTTVKELMDTLYFHWQSTGGLFDVSKPSMTCLYRSKHTFTVSRSKSRKGVEATLWDVPQWRHDSDRDRGSDIDSVPDGEINENNKETGKRLLVFNTHLDPWHVSNRRKQIHEIIDFIEDTLKSIEKGAPSSVLAEDNHVIDEYDWSKTAVLVVGDFNIKAGSEEYLETIRWLKSMTVSLNCSDDWKDFFLVPGETEDNIAQHTYATENSLVEYPEDCGRIDYVFGLQSFKKRGQLESTEHVPTGKSATCIFMPLREVSKSIRREPFGLESSDHYALILELIPAAQTDAYSGP